MIAKWFRMVQNSVYVCRPWGKTNASHELRGAARGRALTSSPMLALAASYALPPGPAHLVMPFNVLVVCVLTSLVT